jgi:hypothetical protein
VSGKPTQRPLTLYVSMSLQLLELVASTAWANGPINQNYEPRPQRTNL